MKTLFFDTHNDRQFNLITWVVLITCLIAAFLILLVGVFPDYRWTIALAYFVLLPGFILREWYNFGHNGFAFALTLLFLVVATIYIIFAWTGFLKY